MKSPFLIIFVFFLCVLKTYSQTKKIYKKFSNTDLKVGDCILAPLILYPISRCEIMPWSKDSVKVIADFIKAHPTFKIEIGAHSDNRGKTEIKILITKCRATAIVDYLTNHLLLPKENLIAKGYGSSELLIGDAVIKKIDKRQEKGKNEVEELHQKNLRVEIKILKTE